MVQIKEEPVAHVVHKLFMSGKPPLSAPHKMAQLRFAFTQLTDKSLTYTFSDSFTGFLKTIFPSNTSNTTWLDGITVPFNICLDNSFNTSF